MEAFAKAHGLLGSEVKPGQGGACERKNSARTFAYKDNWVTRIEEGEIYDIQWSGDDDEWVWAISTGTPDDSGAQIHHLYWSDQHGFELHDRFEDLVEAIKTKKQADGDDTFQRELELPHASAQRIVVHRDDPKKVLVWAQGVYLFYTSDAGKTFTVRDMPANTWGLAHGDIRQHPTRADWIITLAYRMSCYQAQAHGCAMDIFLTKDFGESWTNMTEKAAGKVSGFLDFDWGYHNGDDKYKQNFKEDTILATGHTKQYATPYEIEQEDLHLWRMDSDVKDIRRLAACGASFELVAGQIFFARPDSCTIDVDGHDIEPKSFGKTISLYVSQRGDRFAEVCLPTDLTDTSYTMISTQDGRGAFVIADHENRDAATSNMYANGNIAELYTLSLRNVHFGFRRGTYPDVAHIAPLPGRYIVNQQLSSTGSPYVSDQDFNAVAVTKVSHNAGASWDYIAVDPSSVHNEVCKGPCKGGSNDCYLHLHGSSSWIKGTEGRPAVYASASAPGLVMASGNLGPQKDGLKMDKDQLCTWLSRDGGITWTDVADDVYIYEYFNHGNGIVMAKFREEGPAKMLYASLDQGACFSAIEIVDPDSNDDLFVNNIRVEPDGAATIVHVMATQHLNWSGERRDMVITLDIAAVLRGEDVNHSINEPRSKCDDRDFEYWVPTDDSGSDLCILGKKYKFQRKNANDAERPCFLPKNFVFKSATAEECNCAIEDLYCEYGFEKLPEKQNDCVPMTVGHVDKCPAIEDGSYKMSESHMRLAHHEKCPNIRDFFKDADGNGDLGHRDWYDASHDSGKHKKKSNWGWWLLFVILLVGGGFAFMTYAPDQYKDYAMMVVEPVIGAFVWLVDQCKALFNRASGRRPEELGFERLGDSNQDALYAGP